MKLTNNNKKNYLFLFLSDSISLFLPVSFFYLFLLLSTPSLSSNLNLSFYFILSSVMFFTWCEFCINCTRRKRLYLLSEMKEELMRKYRYSSISIKCKTGGIQIIIVFRLTPNVGLHIYNKIDAKCVPYLLRISTSFQVVVVVSFILEIS